jgi:hypothetical protein
MGLQQVINMVRTYTSGIPEHRKKGIKIAVQEPVWIKDEGQWYSIRQEGRGELGVIPHTRKDKSKLKKYLDKHNIEHAEF